MNPHSAGFGCRQMTGYDYVVFLDICGQLWGFELKVTKCSKSLMGQVSRSLEDSAESCVDFGGPFRGFGGEEYLQLGWKLFL